MSRSTETLVSEYDARLVKIRRSRETSEAYRTQIRGMQRLFEVLTKRAAEGDAAAAAWCAA